MRNLPLLRRLNSTVRTGLLAGAVVMAEPARAQPAADLQTTLGRATAGDVEAQNALGNAYSNGSAGAAQNYAEAFKWYLQAAEKGFAPAQFNVGLAYELGRGVAADEKQAFRYYLKAAEQGFAPAEFNVGNMYSSGRGTGQDYFEANLWFKQAADSGIVDAQFNLGFAYEAGNGVQKDAAQAARWYKLAADRGYVRAQYNLGLLLEDGRGVTRDPATAATLYRAAAEQGFAPAQVNYGLMLSEGRAGSPADPVQGYVWLCRAAQAGAGVEARDALARNLTAEQLAAANRLLGGSNAAPAGAPTASQSGPAPGGTGTLVEQLREQSRRLAGQVASLSSEKEAAERQAAVLTTQIKDLQQELSQARTAAGAAPAAAQPGAEAVGNPAEAAPTSTIIANLQRDNARLNDEVKRSTIELLSLNSQLRSLRAQAPKPAGTEGGDGNAEQLAKLTAEAGQAAEQVARLEADNRRLTARVTELENIPKPATLDTGAAQLKQQVEALLKDKAEQEQWSQSLEKTLNEKSAAATQLESTLGELRQRQARLEQQVQERDQALERQTAAATRLADENKDLNVRLARAEDELKAASSAKTGTDETEALKNRVHPLEQELAAAREAGARNETELTKVRADLAEAVSRATELGKTVADLTQARTELQGQLTTAQGDATNVKALRDSLVQANAQVADLQRDLAAAREQAAGSGAGTADLKRQLAEANQALDKSGATVAELTAANEKLGQDLAAAGKGATEAGALRDEVAKLRREATDTAALREENARLQKQAAEAGPLLAKGEQLAHDNEQLTASVTGSRNDLEKAQGRISELEKQLADALTVHTRGGDGERKLQVQLDDANHGLEKLNATVAELTAANEKLEKDLDSAQKSTAAALAAQSQAVSAANPDAFQVEISTLNARIKQLEAQMEEERAGAAKEVSTLAAQLQRTRETNKSLTEANRALLSAKDSDTAATREETSRLEDQVRVLNAANEELKQGGQKQASDLRTLIAERDTLQIQLQDARKAATAQSGLADEKAALQERLEAVGSQLVKLQREHEDLQKINADLTTQLATTRQNAEKSQADLAAVQDQAAEAEKAAEAHTASVAELTQTNTRLEQEKEDMRRLVESYRGDIARLTQAARTAEQQKADSERSGQQNIDALTAQMTQLRRELEAARANQSRQGEAFAAQERDRASVIAQLRSDNAALSARLNQAQGTLDQIAAAARLGTPAATIASGGVAPVRPAPTPAGDVRYHTVVDGDSLSRISMRYYGTPNRWQEIFQANREVLQGSNALRVGMQLRIP